MNMNNSDPVKSFDGEYGFLSNFSPSLVTLDGHLYPTVEHAFQAAKTLVQNERDHIRKLATPGQAKAAGRRVKLRPDWEEVKLSVMTYLICQKFTINNDLGVKLVLTGDRELIEGNWWHDNFWGVDFRTPEKGLNHLGIILMDRRKELMRHGTR